MPRYFFHLRNDHHVDDQEGRELPDIDAVQDQAVAYAVQMSAVSITEERRLNLNHRIEVTDEAGQELLTVSFRNVLTIVE